MEVEQQTDRNVDELHISQQLRLMNRHQFLDRLDLDNHSAFDNEIKTIVAIQAYSFVGNGKRDLTPEPETRAREFQAKTFLINCLKQSRTQRAMHFHRLTDYPLAQQVIWTINDHDTLTASAPHC